MPMFESEYGPDTTYCEWLAKTRWGGYIHEIEQRAILLGHQQAGEPASALEIGCEGGRWSVMLSKLGWSMTCTDVNDSFLRVCRLRLPDARCVLVTPEDRTFPVGTGSLKLLLCVGVPPAIQSPWFIAEAQRVLAAGGMLVATFWNRSSPRGYLQHLAARFKGAGDQYRLSYPAWRQELTQHGFQLTHEEGYCWFPFRRASNSPLVPLAVATEAAMQLRRLPTISPWVAFVARKT